MGPTASGKTDVAVELVKHFPFEIISVDSAMIYRGMDIGTAKPDAKILAQAPHRLINIRDPSEPYSAGDFYQDTVKEIETILAQKRVPLLTGGTMLYFHALQQGIAALPKANPEIRARLRDEAVQHGWNYLHERLQIIDPVSAERIHPHDPQRLQRALEVYELTGKTLSQIQAESHYPKLPYHFVNLALMPKDRNLLHQKIAQRFERMLQAGFILEVEKLYYRNDLNEELPSIRAVGYRQAWNYLSGNITFLEMQEQAIAATRQLAKRQITWLRSWPNIHIFDVSTPLKEGIFSTHNEQILAEIFHFINKYLPKH